MINLIKFYKDNITVEDYYYKYYYELITKAEEDKKLMEEMNFITSDSPYDERDYEIFDEKDAIKKFKNLCEPNLDVSSIKNTRLFYFLLYYLYKKGYIIEEFPNLLKRPPDTPYDFTYHEIRNKAIELELDLNGTVQYKIRRKIVSQMHFKSNSINIDDDLDKRFIEISTRNANFENMSTDEKLKEIANLIENLLLVNGEYIELDYSTISFSYINNDSIKNYRKQIQCFRHASEKALAERNSFTVEQKDFLIDFGILIIKVINKILNKN